MEKKKKTNTIYKAWWWGGLVAKSSMTLATSWTVGRSVHGITQAKILEWVAISFSRGSSQPSDSTWSPELQAVSYISGGFFANWATREAFYKI